MLLGECIGLVAPLHGVLGGPCSLVGPVHQGYVGGHDECFLLSDPLPRRANLSTTSMVPSSEAWRELPRIPILKLSEKECEQCPTRDFAGIRRAKWTERPLRDDPHGYAAGAFETLQTGSEGMFARVRLLCNVWDKYHKLSASLGPAPVLGWES